MSFSLDDDTPLAAAAKAAVYVRTGLKGTFPAPKKTRVMTIVNQKGGVGKTTTAVNIAATMALAGLKVLLIDLDMQGNASTALGIEHDEGTPGTYDVLIEGAAIADLAVPAEGFDSLLCLPATIDLAGAGVKRGYQIGTHAQGDHYKDPGTWSAMTLSHEGSWWPAWQEWLASHGGRRGKPPAMGAQDHAALDDAPGRYVLAT